MRQLESRTRIEQGDAGGNKVKLLGDASSNLHAYWDDLPGADCQFCAKKVHCAERAAVLGDALPKPAAKAGREMDTAVWVRESFQAARTTVYHSPIAEKDGPYSIVPRSQYETRAERLAWERLALAGARLAAVINQELK